MSAPAATMNAPLPDFGRSRLVLGSLVRACALAGAGVATGWLAWLRPENLPLLLVLPIAAAYSRARWQTFALMAGYFSVGSASLPGIVQTFFPSPSFVTAYGAPALLAAVLAVPFLIYAPNGKPAKRIATYLAALVVLTVLPFGFFAWMNPLMLAGSLYPHLGLLGVVATAALMAALAGVRGRPGPRLLILAAAVGLSGFAVLHYGWRPSYLNESLDYAGIDMASPPADTAHGQTLRTATAVRAMHAALAFPWAKVIVLPESAVSPYRPVDEAMLFEPSFEAQAKGRPIVFGAVILGPNHTWQDVVMGAGTLAGADGAPRIIDRPRLLMPLGNWHLGFPGGATPHPFSTDRGVLAGRPVAWSVCFEDAVLWPHWFLLTGNPTAMISMDNDWALRGTPAQRIQQMSATQLARMAGVPLISARNF